MTRSGGPELGAIYQNVVDNDTAVASSAAWSLFVAEMVYMR